MDNADIKLTHDHFAVVDVNNKWLDIATHRPPLGAKMLLINKNLGVAVLGTWRPSDQWTHWCPLPTFGREPS